MDVIKYLGDIFDKCWEIWNYKIEFSGHSFTLANVAAVTVLIFVAGVILDAMLAKDGWGA